MATKQNYLDVAGMMFHELRQIKRFTEDVRAMDSRDRPADELIIARMLTSVKQRCNTPIRNKIHLHRDLYVDKVKTAINIWEHITPIDIAWSYAQTLDLDSEEDLKKLAEILREYIFVRALVSPSDNALINSYYTNSKNEMPKGWKFGDCRFERYKCLGEEVVNDLKAQMANMK